MINISTHLEECYLKYYNKLFNIKLQVYDDSFLMSQKQGQLCMTVPFYALGLGTGCFDSFLKVYNSGAFEKCQHLTIAFYPKPQNYSVSEDIYKLSTHELSIYQDFIPPVKDLPKILIPCDRMMLGQGCFLLQYKDKELIIHGRERKLEEMLIKPSSIGNLLAEF